MKTLKIILPLLILVVVTNSCKSKKDITKHSASETSKIQAETAITRTITEKAIDTLQLKESILEGTKAIDLICAGDSIYEETESQEIVTKYDPVTKKITTKATSKKRQIPINIDRTIKENINQKSTSAFTKKEDTKEIKKEIIGGLNMNYLWLLLAMVIVFLIWRYIGFKRKKDKLGPET